MKPVWFLDIDGVINPVTEPGNKPIFQNEHARWEKTELLELPVNYSPDVIEYINDISDIVDIVMLSTWKDKAIHVFAPAVGLNVSNFADIAGDMHPNGARKKFSLPPQEEPGMYNRPVAQRWWKMNYVLDHIEKGGANFIWTDDDLSNRAMNYVRRIAGFEGIESLVISPNGEAGLLKRDLDSIDFFLNKIGAKK